MAGRGRAGPGGAGGGGAGVPAPQVPALRGEFRGPPSEPRHPRSPDLSGSPLVFYEPTAKPGFFYLAERASSLAKPDRYRSFQRKPQRGLTTLPQREGTPPYPLSFLPFLHAVDDAKATIHHLFVPARLIHRLVLLFSDDTVSSLESARGCPGST